MIVHWLRLREYLPDPDEIGQSEYTLLYEFVKDLAEQGDLTTEALWATMEELEQWTWVVKFNAYAMQQGWSPFEEDPNA